MRQKEDMMKKKWLKAVPLAAAAVAAVTGWGIVNAQADGSDENVIADRIYIGEVSVGGMTQEEAEDAVNAYVDGLADQTVVLSANEGTIEATVSDLGLDEDVDAAVAEAMEYGKTGNLIERYKAAKDLEHEDKVLPLVMTVDEDKAKDYLNEHVSEVNQEAVNYGLTHENGAFQIVDGKNGMEVDVDASVQALSDYFAQGWTGNASVDLVVEVTEPLGTKEELEKVQDVLGQFSTNYSSSASGRKKNVKNGAGKINGSVIYPGETFSVYETVSPFSAENGYALAGSYENGTTVETYGGGICQVSTTLYNAVIRAELEVVERYGHSMIVGYVDPSSDAAIAGTYKDLKFKNNTDAPIYIEGYADGATIGFTIYGEETRPANRTVSFVSETTSTTQPTVQYKATGASIGTFSKVQSSHVGKTAQLWKVVTVDGVEQSRELFNKTTYKMSPTIYEVGTGSSSAEATAAMKAAIASNDEGTIKSAMAQWNESALQQKAQEEQQAQEGTTSSENGDQTQQGETGTTDTTQQQNTTESSGETQ